MNQTEHNEEINLMEYLEVPWRRKWMIIVPTILISIAVGILSFLQTPVWEVDAIANFSFRLRMAIFQRSSSLTQNRSPAKSMSKSTAALSPRN
jgi:hypothetical protein